MEPIIKSDLNGKVNEIQFEVSFALFHCQNYLYPHLDISTYIKNSMFPKLKNEKEIPNHRVRNINLFKVKTATLIPSIINHSWFVFQLAKQQCPMFIILFLFMDYLLNGLR